MILAFGQRKKAKEGVAETEEEKIGFPPGIKPRNFESSGAGVVWMNMEYRVHQITKMATA